MVFGHGLGKGRNKGTACGHSHGHGIGKMLGTTSISDRGQVVIPDKARKELEIVGDDMFVVFGNKNTGSLILLKSEVFEQFADLFMSKSGKSEKYAQGSVNQTEESEGEEAEESAEEGEEVAPES
jgi:bifunctional DNA-binding transcriptional regulator/antitoxin component of YhaV-PrlF toxin-antitoxin module